MRTQKIPIPTLMKNLHNGLLTTVISTCMELKWEKNAIIHSSKTLTFQVYVKDPVPPRNVQPSFHTAFCILDLVKEQRRLNEKIEKDGQNETWIFVTTLLKYILNEICYQIYDSSSNYLWNIHFHSKSFDPSKLNVF